MFHDTAAAYSSMTTNICSFTDVIAGIVCVGVKQSSIVNNVFTLINMAVIAFILVAGAFKGNYQVILKRI